MKATATEVKNRFGKYLDAAQTEPVIVEKSGRDAAVLLSYQEYERLQALEDAYWAEQAKEAEADGFLGTEATNRLLRG